MADAGVDGDEGDGGGQRYQEVEPSRDALPLQPLKSAYSLPLLHQSREDVEYADDGDDEDSAYAGEDVG